VILELTRSGFEVIICVSGKSGIFLKKHFPELQCVEFPSIKIRYGNRNILLNILLQIPKYVVITFKEHFFLKRHVKKWGIDLVISDNRYGLFHKDIYTIIITHQLFIRLPSTLKFFQGILWKITGKMLTKFNECWIPDLADSEKNLSNELSHGHISLEHYRYIGLLSRFAGKGNQKFTRKHMSCDLLVILSGPEPQRTIFENILLNQMEGLNNRIVIFRGLPSAKRDSYVKGNIILVDNPDDEDFMIFVKHTDKIICRSGYSTIMDLITLEKTALLVPTPGQTEQEYLALNLAAKGLFLCMPQNGFDIMKALNLLEKEQIINYSDLKKDDSILTKTIENLRRIMYK
jgi:hypothetical protein